MTKEDEAYEELDDLIDRISTATQVGVLLVIIDRLKEIQKDSSYTALAVWANDDTAKMDSILKKGRKAVSKAIDEAFDKMDELNREWSEPFYSASKAAYSEKAGDIIAAGKEAVKKRADELMQPSVLGIIEENKDIKTYTPLKKAYRKAINDGVTAMRTGEVTFNQTVGKITRSFSKYGLRVRYASGATRELYGAVRMNVMDGYSRTMAEQREEHGKAFGANGVEITAHAPCAADHDEFQGRRYSDEEYALLQSVTLASRPLVTGYNCRHMAHPVIMGIGNPVYSDSELQKMMQDSREDVTFQGVDKRVKTKDGYKYIPGDELTMSRYDATQYQRKVERAIRKSKEDAAYNLNPDKAASIDRRTKYLNGYYAKMSNEVGLPMRKDRTKLFTAATM